MEPKLTIHLLANAHLDPVWLWDWREGLNEGLQTVRTVLDLMEEYPKLTFIRGESLIYRHLEKNDPVSFEKVRQLVREGRWDVVGGTYIQSDNNLPATEPLLRQFVEGQSYFASQFGRTAKVAWSADAFGHTAGLPDVFTAAGIEGFAFSRPGNSQMPLDSSAFWWEGASGDRVLAYRSPTGSYQSEYFNMRNLLDLALAKSSASPLHNMGVFYGVGNHGGGPVRANLRDIEAWAADHPEVRVIHSTLHRFFGELKAEIGELGDSIIPTRRGELGHCLRGCYASAARFKYAYRRAESRLLAIERTTAALAPIGNSSPDMMEPTWKKLLFSAFHDILPGTSIERAMDEQQAWLGSIETDCQTAELDLLNVLGRQVNTTRLAPAGDYAASTPILVWNPHPFVYSGQVEIEACLDYRPLFAYENRPQEVPVQIIDHAGAPVPFQEIHTEHHFLTHIPWRKRFVVPVTLPPLGWSLLELGVARETVAPTNLETDVWADESKGIGNAFYEVRVAPGDKAVRVLYQGESLFGEQGLTVSTFKDIWGSWGGHYEESESLALGDLIETWEVSDVSVVEKGPERARLFVRLKGAVSSLNLTFSLSRERDAVDVSARLLWNDRHVRLKLVFPVGDQVTYEVPGGSIERGPMGEVPGGKWAEVSRDGRSFGFASDALYCFDSEDGEFRVSVVRSSGYSADLLSPSAGQPVLSVSDLGEYKFNFVFQGSSADIARLSRELDQPPVTLHQPVSPGVLPRSGSLVSVLPETVSVLALKPAEDGQGFILRLQSVVGDVEKASLIWHGQAFALGRLRAGVITSWRIVFEDTGWAIQAESATELGAPLASVENVESDVLVEIV